MKKQYSIIPLAVVAIFCINPLQAEEFRMTQKASAASEFSKIFIEKALTAASFQISSSELALEKTKNFKIKKFAKTMIDNQSKTLEELEGIASETAGFSNQSQSSNATYQALLDRLKNLQSAEMFDHFFVEAQIDVHAELSELFLEYSEKGDNATLKKFAINALSTLKSHKKDLKFLQ